MIWMLRSKTSRHAARAEVVAIAATLREQLIVVRDVTATLDPDEPEWDRARERAKVTHEQFFSAVRHLPRFERRLAAQWEFAAAMTFWYITGDRSFAPVEKRAAALLATLPDGVDRSSAREVIDATTHHAEMGNRGRSSRRGDDNDWAPTVVNQKGLRERIANDRNLLMLQGTLGPDTATLRQAHRHFLPWLEDMTSYLAEHRSQVELETVADQWRIEREKYVYDDHQSANVVIDTAR